MHAPSWLGDEHLSRHASRSFARFSWRLGRAWPACSSYACHGRYPSSYTQRSTRTERTERTEEKRNSDFAASASEEVLLPVFNFWFSTEGLSLFLLLLSWTAFRSCSAFSLRCPLGSGSSWSGSSSARGETAWPWRRTTVRRRPIASSGCSGAASRSRSGCRTPR